MSCNCNTSDLMEMDSNRVWNPVSGFVEYTIFYRCRNCGQTWALGNE